MRNVGGGAQMGKRRLFYMFAQSCGWGIRVVGSLASLDRPGCGYSAQGHKVQQRLRRRNLAPPLWELPKAEAVHLLQSG